MTWRAWTRPPSAGPCGQCSPSPRWTTLPPALPAGDCIAFGVEALPGQFDQRADSAAQCIQLMTQGERPTVRTARVYLLSGQLTAADVDEVKRYVINPVECREASLDLPDAAGGRDRRPGRRGNGHGLHCPGRAGLDTLLARLGLAMDLDDLKFLQAYFRDEEHRDPTLTEIRVVDTYWSDHCRHTTFSTHLDHVEIERSGGPGRLSPVSGRPGGGLRDRESRPAATDPDGYRHHRRQGAEESGGFCRKLDESEEINACSIHVAARWTASRRTGC